MPSVRNSATLDDSDRPAKPPARLDPAELERLAKQARAAKGKSSIDARTLDEDEFQLPQRGGVPAKMPPDGGDTRAKTGNPAQLAAQNMLKSRKQTASRAGMNEEGNDYAPSSPRTYRIDAPPQSVGNPSANGAGGQSQQEGYLQAYGQQQAGAAPYGNVGSYPRAPSARLEPLQSAAQGGFQPPDPAPGLAPARDPKAVMEQIEKLRAQRAVQPSREAQAPSDASEATGTLASQSRFAGDPLPKGPLTFVQFEKGATVLDEAGSKAISAMLKSHAKTLQGKIYLAAGLGGEGDAYSKLLKANQRAQAVSEQIPAQFEVVRRFDPALPNESVRLFVVGSKE